MSIEEVTIDANGEFYGTICDVLQGLHKACEKHPDFPVDIIHQGAIVGEESGELVQAINNHIHEGLPSEQIEKELIDLAAVTIRMLINYRRKRNKT
jgi:NTP pyrophosphatase (non-canonical NTP hydrolase)